MNAELLALIEALDAVKQCPPTKLEEDMRLKAIYASRLAAILERNPNLSRGALEQMISRKYAQWLRAQQKPSTLPPKA